MRFFFQYKTRWCVGMSEIGSQTHEQPEKKQKSPDQKGPISINNNKRFSLMTPKWVF